MVAAADTGIEVEVVGAPAVNGTFVRGLDGGRWTDDGGGQRQREGV